MEIIFNTFHLHSKDLQKFILKLNFSFLNRARVTSTYCIKSLNVTVSFKMSYVFAQGILHVFPAQRGQIGFGIFFYCWPLHYLNCFDVYLCGQWLRRKTRLVVGSIRIRSLWQNVLRGTECFNP